MNWSHSAADVLMFVLSLSSDGQTGASHSKHDVIIESSKFPAAQPPDPNQPSKIETEYWPCPPSLATMGKRSAASYFCSPSHSDILLVQIPLHITAY